MLIGKANRLPRGDGGIIDWLAEKLSGGKLSDMDDGSTRAKNLRMVWGVIRYGLWAIPPAIVLGLWVQSFWPALMVPIVALIGVGYRVAYAALPEHGETAGHAVAGLLFWVAIIVAFIGH